MTLTRDQWQADRANFLRLLPEDLPVCSWCGDHGFRRVTDETVLCVSDWEFYQLHRGNGSW